jgi:lipoprotein-releasing system permease protein
MFQPVSMFIGLRYLRAKRRNHFISFISLASMLSVMNGFEQELRERILGMVSHATIQDMDGNFSEWDTVLSQLVAHSEVIGASPYVEQETLINGRGTAGALIRGIDPLTESSVSELSELMLMGELSDLKREQWGIVLGVGLAARLGVGPGDAVTVFAPRIRSTPVGVVPQVRRFEVVGLFEAGVHEYDTALALMHYSNAQKLFRLEDGVTGIRLKFEDLMRAPRISRELGQSLPGFYRVRDWTQQHANFFRAVQTEKTVMFIILSLIIAVAAFNIISTLVMVVTDKQADIAILKTMGLGPAKIRHIFMIQGSFIGVIGTSIGVVLGVLLALNVETVVAFVEAVLSVDLLSAEVYYISDLPSELRWGDVIRFATLSLVLSLVSTIYPAWRAANTQAVEALRYE